MKKEEENFFYGVLTFGKIGWYIQSGLFVDKEKYHIPLSDTFTTSNPRTSQLKEGEMYRCIADSKGNAIPTQIYQ